MKWEKPELHDLAENKNRLSAQGQCSAGTADTSACTGGGAAGNNCTSGPGASGSCTGGAGVS